MNKIQITETDSGKVIEAPVALYKLNGGEMFLVVGADFSPCREKISFNSGSPHIETNQLGKLSEQGYINIDRIRFTLLNDGWNWQQYPDPEIVLIKHNYKNGKISLTF